MITEYKKHLLAAIFAALIMAGIFWFLWGMPIPWVETRSITISSLHAVVPEYNPHILGGGHIYCELTDTVGREYVLPQGLGSKYWCTSLSWNLSNSIRVGQHYKITLWRSIFGGYVTDGLSNWNPNPKIDTIERSN